MKVFCIGCFLTLFLIAHLQARTFNLSNGDMLTGDAQKMRNGIVVVAKEEGGKVMLSLDKFSEEDQAYLKEKFPQGNEAPRPETAVAKKPQPQQRSVQRPAGSKDVAKSDHPGLANLRVGDQAPALLLRADDTGDEVSLESLKGKVVAVLFWASWQELSLKEASRLAYLQPMYAHTDLEFVGVSLDKSYQAMNAYKDRLKIKWPMALDARQQIAARWGLRGVPTLVIIDRNGTVALENIQAEHLPQFLFERYGFQPQKQ